MDLSIAVVGLVLGCFMGLTGLGGGALVTPFLILFAGVSPVTAVGTSLVVAAVTKLAAAALFHAQGNISYRTAFLLVAGGLPGTLAGVSLLQRVAGLPGLDINHVLTRLLGLALLLLAADLLLRPLPGTENADRILGWLRRMSVGGPVLTALTVVWGVLAGTLSGLTSLGSGSLIVLLLAGRRLPASTVVGTNVFAGGLILTVAALAHVFAGRVDAGLVAYLLLGTLPGAILGSYLAGRIPAILVYPLLAALFLIPGGKAAASNVLVDPQADAHRIADR